MPVNKGMQKKQLNFSVIISILIAFALWIYVMAEVDPNMSSRFNNIEVNIQNAEVLEENGLVLVGEDEHNVDIVVYARASATYGLKDKVSAYIDIAEIQSKGSYELEVQIDGIPDHVNLEAVYPETITLEVDRVTELEKEILIDIEGKPSNNMAILDYKANPEKVTIKGPEGDLKRVHSVVGSINIDGAKEDVVEDVELTPLDKDNKPVEGLELSTKTSTVEVSIGYTKSVQIEPVLMGTPADGYQITEITVDPKEIKLNSKDRLDISSIRTEDINVNGIKDNIQKEVSLVIPEGVNTKTDIRTANVTIKLERIEKRQFTISTIDLIDRPENFDIIMPENSNFLVELEGRKSDIENVKDKDITLYVDLSDLTQGVNTLAVEMKKIDNLNLKSINPSTVSVQASILESENE